MGVGPSPSVHARFLGRAVLDLRVGRGLSLAVSVWHGCSRERKEKEKSRKLKYVKRMCYSFGECYVV